MHSSGVGTSLIIRVESPNSPGAFGALASAIGDAGGIITSVDTRSVGKAAVVRDVAVSVPSEAVGESVRTEIQTQGGGRIISVSDPTFLAHLGGKIRRSKVSVKTRADLRSFTPGVARVSLAIAEDPSKAYNLTIKRNSVGVVSDGSAVLGLGNIGPLAALPVLEGKCMLFKQFAEIDAFPIALDTQDVDAIVATVRRIAPVFGAINLEDISAPRCFEVEQRLIEVLDIPVMHDDQHGTAIVTLAAMINAAAVVGKRIEDMTIVLNGSGAAGTATIKMLLAAGARDVIAVDREGAITRDLEYDKPHWEWLADTPTRPRRGLRRRARRRCFIGVSVPNVLDRDDIKGWRDPIVLRWPTRRRDHAGNGGAVRRGDGDRPQRLSPTRSTTCSSSRIFRGALDAARRITDG